ncbi:MAG TPA: nuclear transport factor 2 family protein [Holophagaceae bacterium]|nr:nuclear transport factor 2 family protein [Holophagaceae bacterium]
MRPLIPCLLALPALAQAPLRSPEAVAAAERAFSELAGKVGTPAAFLATLTTDSIVFTPAVENGPAAQRAKPDDGSRLSWAPEHVELAASGDFALSTGPWAWRPKADAEPLVRGHFLSLWVIRDGAWRVLLDVGVPHALQAAAPLELVALKAPADPGARAALGAAWKRFDAAAETDLGAALSAHRAGDLRLYRRREPVQPGAPSPAAGSPVHWMEGGVHVAASADLAVRWGRRQAPAGVGSAVQVWRREGTLWKLAMDVSLDPQ